MKNTDAYIGVGKIGSTYGVQGWIKILSYTESMANILTYQPWYIEDGRGGWQEMAIVDAEAHGKGIIVKFVGYDSPEQSRVLAGKTIAVLRSQLPPLKKGDYYWDDLKDLTVINQDGETLGKIIYLIATGANDVLVVKGAKEQAIPYILDDVILSIDLENKIMRVNWEEL